MPLHSTTASDYISSLPPAVHPHLEDELDRDNDIDKDLREIADHMLDWDTKLATHLKLTKVDISDIKDENSKSELKRLIFFLKSKGQI